MQATTHDLPPLTPCEKAVLTTLFCRLVVEGKHEFTSDTLRDYGLDNHLYGLKQHAIGTLFAKAKHFGLIEETGRRIRSVQIQNHGRKINVYKRSGK